MLYSVAVAICLSTTPVKDCNRHSAVGWISDIAEVHGLGICQMAGIQEAHSRHLLDAETYPKVYCTPGKSSIVTNVPGNMG